MTDCPPHDLDSVTAFDGRLRLTAVNDRLFDRFLYAGVYDGRPVLVHEYAPYGWVARQPDGELGPIDADSEPQYTTARQQFVAKAQAWRTAAEAFGKTGPMAEIVAMRPGSLTQGAWLVTEYLSRRLTDLPLGDPATVSANLASALAAVFAAGETVGNICPQTLFLRNGQVVFAGPSPDGRDLPGVVNGDGDSGLAGYAAPEVYDARKRQPVGQEADLFAATALIFRLYSGRAPVDVRSQNLAADIDGFLAETPKLPQRIREALKLGLVLSRRARGDGMAAWFEQLKPPPIQNAPPKPETAAVSPTPDPAPVAPRPSSAPVPKKPHNRLLVIAGVVVAGLVGLWGLGAGVSHLKEALAAGEERAAHQAITQCKTAMSSSPGTAQDVCLKALNKVSDKASQDFYDVNYNLAVLCETRHDCAPGKAARDYYRVAANDKTSDQGKLANYKFAKLTPSLSPGEQLDYYAHAAGQLKKPDKSFIAANKDVYGDANYQIGLIFENWSHKDSLDPEEAKRLAPGSARSPQKIAVISAINRLETAKNYGVDADSHLLDLYARRGDMEKDAQQYEAALTAYRNAARLGSADSSFKAAELFFAGDVTSLSEADALDLVNSAAADKNIDALHCVAAMYYLGFPYNEDRDRAGPYMDTLSTLQSSRFDQTLYNGLDCSKWIADGVRKRADN